MEKRTRRPVAYWINVSENPLFESYAFSPSVGGTYERIPAEQIIHVYYSDRMEASRGVPWMASAMPHIKLLQTYLENEVVASSLASVKVATVTNNTGDEYVGSGVEDSYTPLSSIEAGSIEQLPTGWEMKPLEFSQSILYRSTLLIYTSLPEIQNTLKTKQSTEQLVFKVLNLKQRSGTRSEVGGYGKFKNRPAYTGFGTPHRRVHPNTTVLFCIGAERIKESESGPSRHMGQVSSEGWVLKLSKDNSWQLYREGIIYLKQF